ncbi:hypothetical protein ACHAW5_007716 [Stephanodiscus triporus]|uniref:Threonylcarbamoyl-AMP synthase n=1 Tax=Stephanodiscus triporus TaxID=2934178 RepID=A0ABD3MGZ8_9STRA
MVATSNCRANNNIIVNTLRRCMSFLLAAAANSSRHHRFSVSSFAPARAASTSNALGRASSFASRSNRDLGKAGRRPPGIASPPDDDDDDDIVVGGGIPASMSMSTSTSTAEGAAGEEGGDDRTTAPTTTTIARLVPATPSSLDLCGARLRSGLLVSFPTETVYGLGCHALDGDAVRGVFEAKERPLSDPLIVHVSRGVDALEMWAASSSSSSSSSSSAVANDLDGRRLREIETRALTALTSSFFPGPLTVVALAVPSVPPILTAETGYVACRSPSHPVARELISRARVPIAAPSANKFGHVSPTRASHVMDDLGMEDVWIVDPSLGTVGGKEGGEEDRDVDDGDDGEDVCRVGVESTVVKVEMDPPSPSSSGEGGVVGSITVLRHGAVSVRSIRMSIEDAGLSRYFRVSESVRFASEDSINVAPGQTIRHYSPDVPCFMVGPSRQCATRLSDEGAEDGGEGRRPSLDEGELSVLSRSVIIDYGRRLVRYRTHALAYRDLSPGGDPVAAAASVFETLRWSETINGATRVFVPELVVGNAELDGAEGDAWDEIGALALAVKDKLTRAASAVIVDKFQ